MPTRERPVDRGRRLAASDRVRTGDEIRAARRALGRSLADVASTAGMSPSQAGRIERGVLVHVTLDQMSRLGAAVGLDVRTRSYPGVKPTIDGAQLALLHRLGARLHPGLTFTKEVPLPIPGDQRAFDGGVTGFVDGRSERLLPVEAVTRLSDVQAQHRQIRLKLRDAGISDLILLVADTHHNRDALRSVAPDLMADFPIHARTALRALAEGRHPGGSAVVVL